MSKKWLLILVIIAFMNQSCSVDWVKKLNSEEFLNSFMYTLEQMCSNNHAHAKNRGYSYSSVNVLKLIFMNLYTEGNSGETIEITSQPITQDNMPDIDWAEAIAPAQTVSAADTYFDHEMDGVRLGKLDVWFEGEISQMQIPVIISFNATKENTAYASVAFPNFFNTMIYQKPVWQAGYSREVKIIPRSYPSTVDLSFAFNTKMMKGIIPVAKEGKNLKITMTGYFSRGSDYIDFDKATSKGYNPKFHVHLNVYKRMTQTLGMEGLWMGGFVDAIYAGKDLGKYYHPITLLMKHIDTKNSGVNYMTLMTDNKYLTDLKISGKKLWVAQSSSLGYAFDMERKGPDKLVGKFIYRINPDTANYTYTLYRIGFGGNKMRLKRTIPKTAALGNRKNKPTLTIIGVGFAPGAMVYFSDPNIEIKEIQYVNSKKLKVTVQAIDPIKKGQKIGIRVINPDNRSVTKPGILKTK